MKVEFQDKINLVFAARQDIPQIMRPGMINRLPTPLITKTGRWSVLTVFHKISEFQQRSIVEHGSWHTTETKVGILQNNLHCLLKSSSAHGGNFFEQDFNFITRQPVEIESCSNPLRIQQAF